MSRFSWINNENKIFDWSTGEEIVGREEILKLLNNYAKENIALADENKLLKDLYLNAGELNIGDRFCIGTDVVGHLHIHDCLTKKAYGLFDKLEYRQLKSIVDLMNEIIEE